MWLVYVSYRLVLSLCSESKYKLNISVCYKAEVKDHNPLLKICLPVPFFISIGPNWSQS